MSIRSQKKDGKKREKSSKMGWRHVNKGCKKIITSAATRRAEMGETITSAATRRAEMGETIKLNYFIY